MPVLEILSHFNISYVMLKYHIGTWSVDMVRTSLATLTRNSVFNGVILLVTLNPALSSDCPHPLTVHLLTPAWRSFTTPEAISGS